MPGRPIARLLAAQLRAPRRVPGPVVGAWSDGDHRVPVRAPERPGALVLEALAAPEG